MQRNLKTVPSFAAESPFTEGQIRWFIFNAQSNGLAAAAAVVRVGRRVDLTSTDSRRGSTARISRRRPRRERIKV